jgi:hypothetical protein
VVWIVARPVFFEGRLPGLIESHDLTIARASCRILRTNAFLQELGYGVGGVTL